MATKAQGHENTISNDDPVVIVGIFMGVYVAGWAAWHFGHEQMSMAYAYWRYAEFGLLHWLEQVADMPGLRQVHAWLEGLCGPASVAGACTRDFATVSWDEISDSSLIINIGFLILLVTYCVRLYYRTSAVHPSLRFARKHNVKSFVEEQRVIINPKDGHLLYPHLTMFSELNLIDRALDDPVFGMSETSRQFVFNNRLVESWTAEGPGQWAPVIDRQKALNLLRRQLGKHWTSSANLSTAETLMAAIAIPRVAATDASLDDKSFGAAMQASKDMIRYCWEQFVPPKNSGGKRKKGTPEDLGWLKPNIDLEKPRAVIAQYIGTKPVRDILTRHAFNRTVIWALFLQARRLGVLPPCDVRWMRFFDREMWHVMQNIGRQSGYAEGCAALGHFLYEVKAGCALVEPQLDKAVNGLELALNNFKFTDEDKANYLAPDQPSSGAKTKA
jgi:intracellular multiplication protein IcmP